MSITVEISTETPEGGSGSEGNLLVRALQDYANAAKKRFDEKNEAGEMTEGLWAIYQTDINTTLSAFIDRLVEVTEQRAGSTSSQHINNRVRLGEVILDVSTIVPDNVVYEAFSELDALEKAIARYIVDRESTSRELAKIEDPNSSIISEIFNDNGTVDSLRDKLDTLRDEMERADSDDLAAISSEKLSLTLSTDGPNVGGYSEFSLVHYAVNDAYKIVSIEIKAYRDSGGMPGTDSYEDALSEVKALKSLVAKLDDILQEMVQL